jgi:hypothetical protein
MRTPAPLRKPGARFKRNSGELRGPAEGHDLGGTDALPPWAEGDAVGRHRRRARRSGDTEEDARQVNVGAE